MKTFQQHPKSNPFCEYVDVERCWNKTQAVKTIALNEPPDYGSQWMLRKLQNQNECDA